MTSIRKEMKSVLFDSYKKGVMKMRKKDELELKEYDIEPLYGK